MLTGGFRTREGMESALDGGAIDVVGLARPLAAEPDLPRRILEGSTDHARPIRIATGLKALDALIQGSWYQEQLDRMGRGKNPDPSLGRLVPVLRYFLPRSVPKWQAAPSSVPAGATTASPTSAPSHERLAGI
jgi:hypothetical protein